LRRKLKEETKRELQVTWIEGRAWRVDESSGGWIEDVLLIEIPMVDVVVERTMEGKEDLHFPPPNLYVSNRAHDASDTRQRANTHWLRLMIGTNLRMHASAEGCRKAP
jgi:hypothetical protein